MSTAALRAEAATAMGAVGPRPHGDAATVHLLDEGLFRSVLIRERKRSARADRPFILLLADVHDGPGARSGSRREKVIEAFAAAAGDTDVLGWFRRQRTIGLIRTELGTSDPTTARIALEVRLRRELAARLGAAAVARLAPRVHVHLPGRDGEVRPAIADTLKRAIDVLGSLALLALLAPLFLLIAALVKSLSRGPVFFKQVRVGHMNEPFVMLKFRTMYLNADHKLHQDFVSAFITANREGQPPPANGLFKITNDPRVTPVGAILRKTSLDELPQLWNVLRGDMSLVGPRPPIPYEIAQYKGWHRQRIREAKPGITGLWQVTGRSRTTFDDMVRLDLRYARTRSLWMDLKILMATPRAIISGKGAC